MPQTEILVYRDKNGNTPLMDWLEMLLTTNPTVYGKCVNRQLRIRHINVQYRMLYFFSGKNVVIVTHGLSKKGAVPPREINYAIACRKNVLSDPSTFTADFES